MPSLWATTGQLGSKFKVKSLMILVEAGAEGELANRIIQTPF